MKITDIAPETESQYLCCLEEWSDDMKEAGSCKKKWYGSMKDKGLRVKFVHDDNNTIAGMIQYIPIEYSMFKGDNLYVVLCIWIHGHKKGRGDFRKRGMGKALLKAAEEDVRNIGANGLVVWGLILPFFMRSAWFRKQGYETIARKGIMRLLWKPFNDKAVPAQFLKPLKKPSKGSNIVNLTLFRNGWCQSMNITCERAKRAALEFPGKVKVVEIDTTLPGVLGEWGISDSLFIDHREVMTGPPLPYTKIRKKIARSVSRISSDSQFSRS